jgi:CRP-like cAMP-binding protein
MTNLSRPKNVILSALPDEEFEGLRPKLREVSIPLGEIVYLPEQPIEHVYFINSGIISWLAVLEDGNTVEAGVIGPEGIAGMSVVLGAASTPNQGLAQSPIEALKMRAGDLVDEFRKGGQLHNLLLRFVHTMFLQVTQTAACNRLHTLDQRLARWLLMTHDRLDGNKFTLTQDFLSRMLGVRRAGVSVAATSLRQKGLIDYHRGDITILNHVGLEDAVCECYQIVKAEYDRLISATPPHVSRK